ncbi:MAG: peptidylprolyl isomerase [Oscillospiraceae bacterium]|nr:peptidylprolyl isomerase [Oscillospiraceae bacterium]
MSASSKKKLRKEQEAARMTQKQQAAKKEATKLKIYTWSFWVVIALCVAIVAGIALKGPVTVALERMTTAVKVGDHKVTATELNYFYIDAINQYCNEYSSYLSYLLSTTTPLSEQVIDKTTGKTWADNFVDMAVNQAKNTYALYDAAKAAGYELPKDEADAMQKLYDSMDDYAESKGYSNATKYLQSIYGKSASEKSYKKYYEVTSLASSYYNHHTEEIKNSYQPSDLRAFEDGKKYEYNSYSYASFYLNLDKFKEGGTKDDKGNVTYTEAELEAAKAALKEAAENLANAENNSVEKLNAAIEAMEKAMAEKDTSKDEGKDEDKDDSKPDATDPSTEATEPSSEATEPSAEATEPSAEVEAQTDDVSEPTDPSESTGATDPSESTGASEPEATEPSEGDKEEDDKKDDKEEDKEEVKYSTATESKDVLYSKISSVMQEWLRDEARKNGDITAIPYETSTTNSEGKEIKTLKGYYVVLFLDSTDNNFALANVRHILVAFEGGTKNSSTGQTTYSESEKNAAKEKAQKLLDEWKAGAATEDSFAELANKNSDDGDGTTGGLYEDVYPGQMVTNFNDWCFDESRKTGDTGLVESEYGYHVMFYVGDSEELYRDYMITNDKLSEDVEAWQKALNESISLETKNTKYINRDLIIDSSSSYV